MSSRRSLPRWHLLGRSWREVHHDHRLAHGVHALDHVRGAWRLAVPERDEDVSSLGHLVVPAHAGGLPKALPVGLEALPGDLFAPGPTLPQRVGAPGATREDLRDAVAIRREHLTEERVLPTSLRELRFSRAYSLP